MNTADPYAVGAAVVELQYHGLGRYTATPTVVAKVTPQQIHTATGRRFWRKGGGAEVGQRSKQIAGIRIDTRRLVLPDNPRVVEALRGDPQ